MKYINKNLTIEKVNVQKIAKKFGTPTYCYSHKQLTENIKKLKMIKKLILISIICSFLFSCGKKGDPQYEGNEMVFPKSVN